MMKTRICFIRHGETDWNVEKRIQGQLDIALNETGQKQALAMAFNAAHHSFDAIYSSDLERAYVTASALAQRKSLEVVKLEGLRERHFGIFQGLTASEGEQKYPQAYELYKARDIDDPLENGESIKQLSTRIVACVESLVSKHPGQTIAAITHGGVLDIIYRKATGRPLHTPRDFKVPNCGLNWIGFDSQGWHLESWGDSHHLHHVIKESVE